MAFFAACSTDGPVEVMVPRGEIYSEEEYAELVESGEIVDPSYVSDKESSTKSSGSVKSSSSAKADSDSDKTSSSSTKETSGDADSSSADGDKATSSSDGDKATSSSDGGKTSSSSGKVEPASSATPTSSSAVPGQTTISNISGDTGDFSVGQNDMVEVADDVQSELDSLKEILDNGGTVDGFEETDMEFNEETLPVEIFDEQDFFCFTGEGEWLRITKETLGEYIPHYRNDHAWGNLRHFDIKFMDACAAVYIKRK